LGLITRGTAFDRQENVNPQGVLLGYLYGTKVSYGNMRYQLFEREFRPSPHSQRDRRVCAQDPEKGWKYGVLELTHISAKPNFLELACGCTIPWCR